MARLARIIATGVAHHVTQRGNNRQNVFKCDNDRIKYLSFIKQFSHRYNTEILAFCLMNNHVHLVAIPHESASFSRTFNSVNMRYAQYFNRKEMACGHLWQGRFFSCALNEAHLYRAVRYVERNPVRSGLVTHPWDWPWSSAAAHAGISADKFGICSRRNILDIENWKKYLMENETSGEIDSLRKNTKTGRPLGDDDFLAKLEEMLKRDIKIKRVGRPKKLVSCPHINYVE